MRWRALIVGGACAVSPLAILGCSLLAPLGGLAGNEPDATPSFTGDEPSTDSSAPPDIGAPDVSVHDSTSPAPETGTSVHDSSAADTEKAEADSSPADATHDAVSEPPPVAPIAFVQIAASSPTGSVVSVTAKLAQAQAAGDLDVVAIGWNDTTSTISQVTDSAGNVYALAAGTTTLGQDLSQAIYYAKDIHGSAAGANSVTVTFVQAANVPDLRVVEYSGLDTAAPLGPVATATGTSVGPASVGPVSTTVARELLFAAGMTTDMYSGAGTGFTIRVVTTAGDMVEDRTVSATGSYSATAPVGASCEWLMQLATFH
jgi:hypothetical protein